MHPSAGRWGWLLAAWLLVLIQALGRESEATGDEADSLPATPAAVALDYRANQPESFSIYKNCLPSDHSDFRVAISYFSPLVQLCEYSSHNTGPTGSVLLPDRRRLCSELIFSVGIAGAERRFSTRSADTHCRLSLQPGRLVENWTWPDGLKIERTYFQSPRIQGTAVRFMLQNQGQSTFHGVRLIATLKNSEIIGEEKRNYHAEHDDDMIMDMRNSVFCQRDHQWREEGWLGIGWNQEGGFVSNGEEASLREPGATAQAEGQGRSIVLETPAMDLLPGQKQTAVLWFVWGNEQNAVMKSFLLLRQRPAKDYELWRAAAEQGMSQGLKFNCRDPYLTVLFLLAKAWSPWMARLDTSERIHFVSLENAGPSTLEAIAGGADGLIALGKRFQIKQYLDGCLDERLESPAAAYTAILAHRYYQLTHDHRWLADNSIRLRELAYHLLNFDRNQDGLPDYTYDDEQTVLEDGIPRSKKRRIRSFNHGVAGIRAFMALAELLELGTDQESMEVANRCRIRALVGKKKLDVLFWCPAADREGYYAAQYSPWEGRSPYKCLDAIEMVYYQLADASKLKMIFNNFWNAPDWRTSAGYYRRFVPVAASKYKTILPEQKQLGFSQEQLLLLLGLREQKIATEAVSRLLAYARQVITDPERLGVTGAGGSGPIAMDISSLNLMQVITLGLCGLKPTENGLQVHVPDYEQDLGVSIRNFPFRHALLDVQISGKGGRHAEVIINGRKRKNQCLISNQELASGKIAIRIKRLP